MNVEDNEATGKENKLLDSILNGDDSPEKDNSHALLSAILDGEDTPVKEHDVNQTIPSSSINQTSTTLASIVVKPPPGQPALDSCKAAPLSSSPLPSQSKLTSPEKLPFHPRRRHNENNNNIPKPQRKLSKNNQSGEQGEDQQGILFYNDYLSLQQFKLII